MVDLSIVLWQFARPGTWHGRSENFQVESLVKIPWGFRNAISRQKTIGFSKYWKTQTDRIYIYIPGWWFGTFFIILSFDFHIFQRGRSTTNQTSWSLSKIDSSLTVTYGQEKLLQCSKLLLVDD